MALEIPSSEPSPHAPWVEKPTTDQVHSSLFFFFLLSLYFLVHNVPHLFSTVISQT